MRYETVHGVTLPKIGFGTWKIGGAGSADPSLDSDSLAALRSALDMGYRHFDTAEVYAGGHAEELVGQALTASGVSREQVFVTSKVAPTHLSYKAVLTACEQSLKRLHTEYLDLYLVHWPNPLIKLEETFRALNELVRRGKVKHLGVSNFKLKMLKRARELSESPLVADQVPFSIPQTTYVKNGVLEFCIENETLLTAYSPLKFRDLNVNKTLKQIAEAHSATSHQIALAWVVSHPRVITIPMSYRPLHQRENLAAADIELSGAEMETLNALYRRSGNAPASGQAK